MVIAYALRSSSNMHTRGSEKATSASKDWPAEAIDNPTAGPRDSQVDIRESVAQEPVDDVVTKEYQHGVQGAQAMTHLWGKKQLILAYIL